MRPTSEPLDAIILIDGLESRDLSTLRSRVEAAVLATLAAQDLSPTRGAELSLTFVTDDEIAALNREWLGRDGPTDVIAFSLGSEPMVGDVYISFDAARRQAEEFSVGVDEEILRLAIHGVLHVAGYDHSDGGDRLESPMYLLQEGVLDRLLEGGAGG